MEPVRRAVLAETGVPGADQVVRAASRLLRDRGVEVVQLGVVGSAALAEVALQEDAAAVGLPVGEGHEALAGVAALGDPTTSGWETDLPGRLGLVVGGPDLSD
jgi:methylmalonyl-CoA mutase cobalamin-binding subunit